LTTKENVGYGKLYTPKNECTFSPKINPNTNEILAGSEFEGCDFLSRQELFVRKFKQHKIMKKLQYPNIFTFQPKIGNASIILQYSPLQEGNRETTCERLERLSYQDNVRRHHIRQRISDNYYAQFKFQPQIDQTSNELVVGASTHYELHKNEKGKKTKKTLEQSAYQEFMQKCTFHPEVNVHKSHHNLERILQNRRKFRKQKTKSIEQLQAERELEEFKECTFKPIVHEVPPKPMEAIVIKGLGRHLELQELAKQMKKDHEEWERKVFFSHVFAKTKRQYTIPKPFVFHNGRPSNKRASGHVDLCTGDLTSKTTTPSEPCPSTSLTTIEQHTSITPPTTDVSLQNIITDGTILGST